MLAAKLIAVVTLWSFVLSGGGATGCGTKQKAAPQTEGWQATMPERQQKENQGGELKVLDEGFHSNVSNSFIAVARDAETYAALATLDSNLPKLDGEFFKSRTVIAAFLGQRNTGGYSVEIARGKDGKIQVDEKVPEKGVMVPEMITAPFKIVTVEVGSTAPVLLSIDSAWRQKMQSYRVTTGKFTMSGGFAGTVEQFTLEGEVRVMRERNLATFAFGILSSGLAKKRSLISFETGEVQTGGQIVMHKISADALVTPPNGGLKAIGAFTVGAKKLSLTFTSLPPYVSDGYVGEGSIEAELKGSA